MRILVLICFLASFQPISLGQKENIIVVIDPGHGGTDPGHLSSNKNHLAEKELNMLIAKKFGSYIEQYLQHVTIVYTRTDDTYPTLEDRVNVANTSNADYFISIHCNANHQQKVHGTESHVHTLKSKKSVALAQEFEKEFTTRAGRYSRGVKDSEDREHSLQVLKFTNMTSVLVECGFLTNDREANYLNTTSGQDVLASAIYRAFRNVIVKEHKAISFIKSEKATNKTVAKENSTDKNSYTIQLMSSKEPIDTEAKSFKNIGVPIERKKLNTSSAYKYLYTTGTYTSQDSAKKDLEKIQKNGFKDAYIKRL
jgi:N-acetylmuramoyl-L-alanine amidase